MLENIHSRWELLTNGIGYQSQSEQHRARRPSSEGSCKPNSRRKIGRKQGQEKKSKRTMTGGKPKWPHGDDYQYGDGLMETGSVHDTLLHGGLDSSRHVSCMYNRKLQTSRLETIFFSNSVVEAWNYIPSEIKNSKLEDTTLQVCWYAYVNPFLRSRGQRGNKKPAYARNTGCVYLTGREREIGGWSRFQRMGSERTLLPTRPFKKMPFFVKWLCLFRIGSGIRIRWWSAWYKKSDQIVHKLFRVHNVD